MTLSVITWPAASSAASSTTGPPINTPAIAALGLLALVPLLAGTRTGHNRLRDLRAPVVADVGPAPVVRPSWVIIGAASAALLAGVVAGPIVGVVVGAAAGVAGGLAGCLAARRAASRAGPDGGGAGDLAGSWELLAVCLEAGLPVSVAVSAATDSLFGAVGTQLRRIAGLLALGADPAAAWASTEDVPALAAFARAAGRSAGTGAGLAQVARAEGARLRAELLDSAQARAQRAAVLITGPLGLCFLPAFLALGIAPVVIGLANEALAQW
jgi:pilus assembly protein TadC